MHVTRLCSGLVMQLTADTPADLQLLERFFEALDGDAAVRLTTQLELLAAWEQEPGVRLELDGEE